MKEEDPDSDSHVQCRNIIQHLCGASATNGKSTKHVPLAKKKMPLGSRSLDENNASYSSKGTVVWLKVEVRYNIQTRVSKEFTSVID